MVIVVVMSHASEVVIGPLYWPFWKLTSTAGTKEQLSVQRGLPPAAAGNQREGRV